MKYLSNQQIFNKVAKHLLNQNEKATNIQETLCYYRLKKNGKILKCAAGCLIKHKHYSRSFEGRGVGDPDVSRALQKSGINMKNLITNSLVHRLQTVHDGNDEPEWHEELKRQGEFLKLNLRVVNIT